MKYWTKENAAEFERRNRAICEAYGKPDATYQSVGDAFGIGRERVRQIVKSAERRDLARCRRCHPQHFWVGDTFFGHHSTLMQLHPYEREGHEPIEIMADVVYKKYNPRGRDEARAEICRSAAVRFRANLENPAFLNALRWPPTR